MNNREANWYSHPPSCSCSNCTRKRLNAPPPKVKPQPYNAKKAKKKAKLTKLHPDDWTRLMQSIKPKDELQEPGGGTAGAEQPESTSVEPGDHSAFPAAPDAADNTGSEPSGGKDVGAE